MPQFQKTIFQISCGKGGVDFPAAAAELVGLAIVADFRFYGQDTTLDV